MLLTKLILKSFKKKRKESSSCHALLWSCFHALLCFDLAMLLLTKSAPTKRQKISALQLIPHVLETKIRNSLFSHYSPVTIHPLLFMTPFTPNFCLFKGGCPLCLYDLVHRLREAIVFSKFDMKSGF